MHKEIRCLKVILCVLLITLGLVGCGKSYSSLDQSKSGQVEEAQTEKSFDNQVEGQKEICQDENQPEVNTAMQYDRKIIKTGELEIQTKQFKECVESLIHTVEETGGFIQSSNAEGANYYTEYENMRTAFLMVRIPKNQFDVFMNSSHEYGNVISTSTNSEDITDQYIDTEMRLKSLKVSHERLLKLLEQSGSLEEQFKIEKELSNVTYEIEKMSGNLQKYDALVDMSTINIRVHEVEKIKTPVAVVTFGDKMTLTFKNSVEKLICFGKGLVLVTVACIPFLIVVVPITLIIIFFIRQVNNKKKRVNKQQIEEKIKEEKKK